MEDSEVIPSKRRKIEDDQEGKSGSNDDSSDNVDVERSATSKTPLKGFQLKPSIIIERLKKITSKSISPPKSDSSEEKERSKTNGVKSKHGEENGNDAENDELDNTSVGNDDVTTDVTMGEDVTTNDDVIISSTGTSPAHSPKPENFKMLSTPPRRFKNTNPGQANLSQTLGKASHNLIDKFDATGSPVIPACSATNVNRIENEAVSSITDNDIQQSEAISDKTDKDDEAGGAMSSSEVPSGEPSETRPSSESETRPSSELETRPSSGLETRPSSESETRPSSTFNSEELKALLKHMVDEKFKQIESAHDTNDAECELRRRIGCLEEENRSLNEYAKRLEKAVTLLLANQKSRPEKLCKSIQTVNVRDMPTKDAVLRSVLSRNLNTPSTEVTARLTSSVACMPGHSVTPSALPQQAQPQAKAPLPTSTAAPTQAVLIPQKPPPPYNVSLQTRPVVAQNRVGVSMSAVNPGTVAMQPALQQQAVVQAGQPVQVSGGLVYVPSAPQQRVFVSGVQPQQVVAPPMQTHPSLQTQQRVVAANQPQLASLRPAVAQQIQHTVPRQQLPSYQQQSVLLARSPPVARPPQAPVVLPQQLPVTPGVPVASPPAVLQRGYRPPQQQPGPPREVAPEMQAAAPGIPAVATSKQKDPPPRPVVSIAVVSNGIVLSWNMQGTSNMARVVRYQLFALQDGTPNGAPQQWKKIGVVNALPLPMACTLTQFMSGNKYHFAVRAMDEFGRSGPFSEPCTITLK